MDTVHNEFPLIRTAKNFLTTAECNSVIDLAKSQIKVQNDTESEINDSNAISTTITWQDHEITKKIVDRISAYTGYDTSHIEGISVTHTMPRYSSTVSHDYIVGDVEDSNQIQSASHLMGGNRIGTVILYLNDIERGGQTYFPWMDIKIQPETGKICQIKYDYDDWNYNVRTQYAISEFDSGERWFATIWVREDDTSKVKSDYKTFYQESKILERIVETSHVMEVGPEHDRRTLKITLPPNNNPRNTILVGFTGGVESSLLLYLISIVNKKQVIPYNILPVCATSHFDYEHKKKIGHELINELFINEVWDNTVEVLNIIRKLSECRIKDVDFPSCYANVPRKWHVFSGMTRLLNYSSDGKTDFKKKYRRYYDFKYVYFGVIENPVDTSDSRWKHLPPQLPVNPDYRFNRPFQTLQKYHIVDAMLQLNLDEIWEHMYNCQAIHESLDAPCPNGNFTCNHRRWAWTVINKHTLGEKYLLRRNNE